MNIFDSEFRGSLFTGDRRLQSNYKIKANTNRSDYIMAGNLSPFDLSGGSSLTINYAYDPLLLGYSQLVIDIAGVDINKTYDTEIIDILNNDSDFKELFSAKIQSGKILITSKKNKVNFRSYISNTGAETAIGFNLMAPVAQLPSYFERYAFNNINSYMNLGPDRLILLNPSDPIDSDIIDAAGFDSGNPTPDWQLLNGINDAFWFDKKTYVDGKIAYEIKYPAGAKVGDLGKKTIYTYDVAPFDTDLIEVAEIPYILTSGDLITV
jgi:hypothetical protein